MLSKIKNKTIWRHLPTAVVIFSTISQVNIAVAETSENIYQNSCAFCHSRPFPPFTGPELRGRNLKPDYIKARIRYGAKGMITFTKADISDQELDALGQWLQASQAPVMRGPQ